MKQTKKVTKVAKEKLVTINEVTYTELVTKSVDNDFYKFWVNIKSIKADKIKFDRLTLLNYLLYYASNKNTVLVKINELAKKFKVTRQTLSKKLKELEEDNYIKVKTNVILINPTYFFKGTAKGRNKVTDLFENN